MKAIGHEDGLDGFEGEYLLAQIKEYVYDKEDIPNTIKVRIAVVIDSEGTWSAAGWSGDQTDTMNEAEAIQEMTNYVNFYWLTAEIEMPEIKEIEALEVNRV